MAEQGTVAGYLLDLEPADAEVIGHVYAVAREVVPSAEEGVSYGMPALIYRGKPLLSVMRAKKHVGLYPYSSTVVAAVADAVTEVPGTSTDKGTIRFQPTVPLPDAVVRQIVVARRDQIDGVTP
ncbi:iron chaperone [Cellulomonas soli]|nr:DUF1801 domain-containing protein [Cellulomonas soli]NYI58913.1 uncharacterized protein YdhG (YjbR/CyaY superfamily) [Cellulomonas soli]